MNVNEAESVDALGTAVGRLAQKETSRHAYRYDEKSPPAKTGRRYVRGREAVSFQENESSVRLIKD